MMSGFADSDHLMLTNREFFRIPTMWSQSTIPTLQTDRRNGQTTSIRIPRSA